MLGARPLLIALGEASLEEALRDLRVELRAGPVGLGELSFGFALGELDSEEQTAPRVGVVLDVAGLAQPALEGVLAHPHEARGRAARRAARADELARALDEVVGDGERRSSRSRRWRRRVGILSVTHFTSPWVFGGRLGARLLGLPGGAEPLAIRLALALAAVRGEPIGRRAVAGELGERSLG